jgi:hypothetical protein
MEGTYAPPLAAPTPAFLTSSDPSRALTAAELQSILDVNDPVTGNKRCEGCGGAARGVLCLPATLRCVGPCTAHTHQTLSSCCLGARFSDLLRERERARHHKASQRSALQSVACMASALYGKGCGDRGSQCPLGPAAACHPALFSALHGLDWSTVGSSAAGLLGGWTRP